jgi:hypothetical protein
MRGHGSHELHGHNIPRYFRDKFGPIDDPSAYISFVKGSIHGPLELRKKTGNVVLSLLPVRRGDLDYFFSDRPDFLESVAYWRDQIKNGRTVPPILVHRMPNGKYAVLDGCARVQAYKEMAIDEYPAVENSLTDILRRGAVKAQNIISKGAEYAARKTYELPRAGLKFGKEYGKELAKSTRFEIGERAKEARESAVGGMRKFYEEQKERGKFELLQMLQSGEVKRLLLQAESKSSYVSNLAKQRLQKYYPLVWANSKYAPKVSIVRHEEIRGRGYPEEVAERKEIGKATEKASGEREVRKLKTLGKEVPQRLLKYDSDYQAEQERKKEAQREFDNLKEASSRLEGKTEIVQIGSESRRPPVDVLEIITDKGSRRFVADTPEHREELDRLQRVIQTSTLAEGKKASAEFASKNARWGKPIKESEIGKA